MGFIESRVSAVISPDILENFMWTVTDKLYGEVEPGADQRQKHQNLI